VTELMRLPKPSLAAQIAELKRERKMRERVYPFWITSKKIRQHDADYQMAALDAAIETLEALR
jgi:hypothetical protein